MSPAFVGFVRDLQSRLDERQVRVIVANLLRARVPLLSFAPCRTVDEVLAAVAAAPTSPLPLPLPPPEPEPDPPPEPDPIQAACDLLHRLLVDGPLPGDEVEAAAHDAGIAPESLLEACDLLRVLSQRGEWRIPERRRRQAQPAT